MEAGKGSKLPTCPFPAALRCEPDRPHLYLLHLILDRSCVVHRPFGPSVAYNGYTRFIWSSAPNGVEVRVLEKIQRAGAEPLPWPIRRSLGLPSTGRRFPRRLCRRSSVGRFLLCAPFSRDKARRSFVGRRPVTETARGCFPRPQSPTDPTKRPDDFDCYHRIHVC